MTTPTPDLLTLVRRGDAAELEAALGAGANPEATDRWGIGALARAAAKGDLAMVDVLLDRGARVDCASDAGNTPLMAAAARGHLAVVERLLAAGADPAHANKWGLGPADWAEWAANTAEIRAVLQTARD